VCCVWTVDTLICTRNMSALSHKLCERPGCFVKGCRGVVRNDEGVSCSVCGHPAVMPVSLKTSVKAQGVFVKGVWRGGCK
jgi:hypothetical protein